MIWLAAWSRFNHRRITNVGAGLPAMAACQSTPLSQASQLPHFFDRVGLLECERQVDIDLLTLCQAMFELSWIVNQHILPGKRLGRDQS